MFKFIQRVTLKKEVPGAERLLPWVVFFLIFFVWGWRVSDMFTHIPAYGDVFEFIWGVQWWFGGLLLQRWAPFYTSIIFHPTGWYPTTWALSPMLFVLSFPLYAIGGAVFAYNVLALLLFVLLFAGILRFLRFFSRDIVSVTAAALVFVGFEWWRVIVGHVNLLGAMGLLTWLACILMRARDADPERLTRYALIAGLIWGMMVNFSLYGVFLGGLVFILWGRKLLRWSRYVILAGAIALVIGLPSIIPFVLGIHQTPAHYHSARRLMLWGSSLNGLFVPKVFHPLPLFQKLAHLVYKGPVDETVFTSKGLLTGVLALAGVWVTLRNKGKLGGLVALTIIGMVLGLGLLVRWDGDVVHFSLFRPLNVAIWKVGHFLKPHIFTSAIPDPDFEVGIPLPGLVLTVLVPFWEAGRTVTRYAVIGMLGAVALASMALERIPPAVRFLLAGLWVLEMLPVPTNNFPFPQRIHPAYEWLAHQTLEPGEGVADLQYPALKLGGETLWAAWLHGKPTVSGTGTFWPEPFFTLREHLWKDEKALVGKETWAILEQYRIRYLLIHISGDFEREWWRSVQNHPAYWPIGCFDPAPGPSPWEYPICVAEVKKRPGSIHLWLREGWSAMEDWGIWAIGTESRAMWLAERPGNYRLQVAAFPLCVPENHQKISIRINGREIGSHQWRDCESWEGELLIPASLVRVGWNEITFHYEYAFKPVEITKGTNPDPRPLAVGFTRLKVLKQNP